MIRLLILVSLGTAVSAASIPVNIENYPRNLAWLFGLDTKTTAKPTKERTVCNTQECQIIAKVIKDSMDDTVDPCDDFYEYACGNWPKNNPIPEDQVSWDLWHMVQKNIENQIKGLLDVDIKPDDILAVKLAKKWYRICVDADRVEASGLEPLLSTISRHGGWPMIMEPDEWDGHMYKWQKVDDHYARLIGFNAFFDVRVGQFSWESDDKVVLFDTPHFGPGSYKLGGKPPAGDDELSDEEENSDEDEEPGSEQSNEDKDEDEDEDKDESEDEDENKDTDESEDEDKSEDEGKKKLKRKKVSNRKSNKKVKKVEKKSDKEVDRKTRKNKVSSKRVSEKKSKRRIKRRATKVKQHSNKQRKVKITKKKVNHHATKIRVKTPSYKKMAVDDETDVSAEKKSSEKQDENNDETENKSDDEKNEDESTDEDERKDNEGSDDENEENSDGDDDNDDEEDDDNDEDDDDDDDSEEDDREKFEQRVKQFENYVFDVAKILAEARDADISEEKLRKDVKDMVDFYIKLIQLRYLDSAYVNMTLNELQEEYDSYNPETPNSKVNWISKVQKLFREAEVEVDENLEMTVGCMKFLKGLRKLLDETPNEVVVNFVHWDFISKVLFTSTEKMKDLFLSWVNHGANETREEMCLQQVEMTEIVAYEYVRKYFSDEIAKTAMDMIDDIQKEVEYQIKESTWMDEKTQDFILDKLVNMEKLVGYPDWYRNDTIVRRYFQGLTVGPSYYENVLGYMRYYKWKTLQELEKPEDEDTWFIDPVTLNAFFMPTQNSITITAADFQSPFFAFNRPQSINFGIIGFVMAHEVNHGFDNDGHLYDKNGEVMEWLSTMAGAYNRRAECFVDQFNKYTLTKGDNFTIEDYGNQTAGENIADTMGLQAVFRAYRRRERECGKPDAALPGLENFDNDQLFFLSFANLWCEALDQEMAVAYAMFDEHSTNRLRVIGSVSNSHDFAKAFKCPVGSPMNPEKKCSIWK